MRSRWGACAVVALVVVAGLVSATHADAAEPLSFKDAGGLHVE